MSTTPFAGFAIHHIVEVIVAEQDGALPAHNADMFVLTINSSITKLSKHTSRHERTHGLPARRGSF
jgi:hypothetical protein